MGRLRFAPLGIRTASLIAASALLGLACSDTGPVTPPVTDRFFYPTGLAIRHVDANGAPAPANCLAGTDTCRTQLLVVSSNFDLRFDSASGGTVMAVDVDRALQLYDPSQPPQPLQPATAGGAQLGVARIGSFGGEVAILDGTTCSGFGGAEALVASRSLNVLYRVSIGANGELSCGGGCRLPLQSTFGDPYGVTVACGNFGGTDQQLAFVTYLRTPDSEGQLSQIDLATGNRTEKDLGSVSTARSTVFDASSARLYVTQLFAEVGSSPLRWFSLAAAEDVSSMNLYSLVPGAELRSMAISSDSQRAYLALRIYDVDTASATGLRPLDDVGGALAVMDISPGPGGQPAARLLNVVPIDRGASEIQVVPRIDPATSQQRVDPRSGEPLRDLVAVTCTDDSTLTLYDDQTGSVAKVFGICGGVAGELQPVPCKFGDPLTGGQPFGLAVEPLANGDARLYVGSFDRWWINVIEINPLNPTASPASWARIGPERQ
jgi:hypothetical protein